MSGVEQAETEQLMLLCIDPRLLELSLKNLSIFYQKSGILIIQATYSLMIHGYQLRFWN